MKKPLFAAAFAALTLWCAQLPVFAEESASAQEAAGRAGTLLVMGKFIGYFLLVMGVIFAALLLTNWIGKKFGKH